MYDQRKQVCDSRPTADTCNIIGGVGPAVECKGERPVIETMSITANRLEDIERKTSTIHCYLFGPDPTDGCDTECGTPSNVKSLAGSAFSATVRIERMLDEIYSRLA